MEFAPNPCAYKKEANNRTLFFMGAFNSSFIAFNAGVVMCWVMVQICVWPS